jgi:predicted lipoprotein with Yx(FWY)xxD motif
VKHRAARVGTVLLTTGLLAAMTAPALATSHHKAKVEKGTVISSAKVTKGTVSLGRVLTSSKGRVMYLYRADKSTVSRCTGECRTAWPRVMSAAKPRAAKGVRAGHLSRNKHHQVTYYGHPLYYFAGDHKAGKSTGEAANDFYVVSLTGKAVKPPRKHTKPTGPTGPTGPAEISTGTVGTGASATTALTNGAGRTLYALFTPDEKSTYSCTGSCLSTWLPVLTKGAPTTGGDASSPMVSTVTRSGVGTQVTYNGYPLYTYVSDTKAGQNDGEGQFGPAYFAPPYPFQYWYELSAGGSSVTH